MPREKGPTETLTITLRALRQAGACNPRYEVFRLAAKAQGYTKPTEPIPLSLALESNGLDDTLWALQAVPPSDAKRRIVSLWLADILEHIEHLMTDDISKTVIPLLRRHALAPVPQAEWDAAGDAAGAAAWDAAGAAARAAAWAAARAAAWAAERNWQTAQLMKRLTESGEEAPAP